ncbi:NADP-dependent 3-hydroxy acid dehydrogenase YdfG [Mumia flava]|uniref:NADP-dependent 3-hydroxy acid dehydrogenase YdfG n=1 Tax=Mumia flava TaxID=1348852 RepID=A0A2M9BIW7_9ACTN|nr:SDR family NAD(P)-dependent oxidoreductase [Mumia flava]PJJ57895.1 NADP-dependent 3-hydroxy acid dehydrogenase YdfG [Mumia flava]
MTVRTGDRVLVTGAASGFGLALTTALLDRGCRVLATDVHAPTPPTLDALGAGAGGTLAYRRLDVTSEADWAAALDDAEQRWSGLDVLVNNAGVAAGGPIDATTEDGWDRITGINLLGVARGCRTVAPLMKKRRAGLIVNVASAAGLVHPPRMSEYNAVKAGVVALSETLRWELEPYGVGVAVVCPSFFRTNLADSIHGPDPSAADSARALIEGSSRSAADVAGETLRQLDAGRHLVLPDRDARLAYLAKRFLPALYRAAMRRAATKAAAEEQSATGARTDGAKVVG